MTAIHHPAYRRFAVGALLSNASIWMLRLGQTLLILDLTHGSGVAGGVVAALQFLPLLLLGPWIGVLADRISKRGLLIWADLLMSAIAGLQAVLILTGLIATGEVFVLTLLFGVGSALDFPLRLAVVPEIVPQSDIASGVALNAVSVQLGRLVGPALAGFLASTGGLWIVFGVAATGFSVFASLLGGIAVSAVLKRSAPAHAATATAQVREALTYISRNRGLRLIFVLIATGGVAGPNILNLAALMATKVFAKGPATVGLYGTVMALGALAGAVGVVRAGRPTLRVAVAGALALGVSTVASAMAPGPVSFGVLLAIAGLAALVMVSTATALVQVATHGPIRGRVTSLYSIAPMCGIPIASPPLVVIAQLAGVRWNIALAGTIVTLSACGVAVFSHPRRGQSHASAAAAARSAADRRQLAAAALARTCSGRVAPAMTDATVSEEAR